MSKPSTPFTLTPEQRGRYEHIRADGLKYVDFQAAAHEDAKKAGMPVDVEYRYLVLNAATVALEHDDRAREATARGREVRATIFVATVATAATAIQAIAMVIDLVRQ